MLNTDLMQSKQNRPRFTLPRVDGVVASIIGLFVIIAVFDFAQLPTSFQSTVTALVSISPFFILSIGVAAYAKASGAEHLIASIFAGNPVRMIVLASLFGALSPFCSCGVIPLVAGLLIAGVPLAPVMAFWLSSPLMDPQMFIISTAAIGLHFTVAKTVAAIGIGLLGGFLTHIVVNAGAFPMPLRIAQTSTCGGSSCNSSTDKVTVNWKPWRERERTNVFLSSAKDNAWFLGRWLTLAFAIESLMVAYVPSSIIVDWLGSDAWWTMPLAVGVGIPSYLNGFAAVPLIASLIEMGMMPGAAMAFMIAGGVTSIPAAMAVFALARKPLFMWYIALSLVGALTAGIMYQLVYVYFG